MSDPECTFRVWDCDRLFRLKCPLKWDALDATADPSVRHCQSCGKEVHLCRTPADFVHHAEQGRCVAIPGNMSSGGYLGEPSPSVKLRDIEAEERGAAWWEDVVGRRPALDAERMAAVRAALEKGSQRFHYSPEHVAILRLAVQAGGVRCPRCGFDIANDTFGIMIYLDTRRCENCREPFDVEFPSS